MLLDIPDDIVRRSEANALDLQLALAVQLYSDNRLEFDDACRLSQLPPPEFSRELLHRGLTVQHCQSTLRHKAG